MKLKKEKEMADHKNAKNILTAPKKKLDLPAYRRQMDPHYVKRIVELDAESVPGAKFYSEAMWILPGDPGPLIQVDSHTHDFGEEIGFFGFNYEDIHDLGAEIEITIDNQKYNVTKSFLAYVPPGMQHGPIVIKNVKRPVMHFTAGPTTKYK
jgi:hypothetical protein